MIFVVLFYLSITQYTSIALTSARVRYTLVKCTRKQTERRGIRARVHD